MHSASAWRRSVGCTCRKRQRLRELAVLEHAVGLSELWVHSSSVADSTCSPTQRCGVSCPRRRKGPCLARVPPASLPSAVDIAPTCTHFNVTPNCTRPRTRPRPSRPTRLRIKNERLPRSTQSLEAAWESRGQRAKSLWWSPPAAKTMMATHRLQSVLARARY